MPQYRDYGYITARSSHVHEYIRKPLLDMLDPETNRCILDMGCGNGSLSHFLIRQGFDCYGVDASESGIAIASEGFPDRFNTMDFSSDSLPVSFRWKAFDTIISTEVIEHLYDPREFISNCRNLLSQKGGQLIISTPYHGYLKNLLIGLTGNWDKHMNPLWDGGHIKLWSRGSLTQLLGEQGFKVTGFTGCGRFPYLWKSMLVKAVLSES